MFIKRKHSLIKTTLKLRKLRARYFTTFIKNGNSSVEPTTFNCSHSEVRNLLSINDLSSKELGIIVNRAHQIKQIIKNDKQSTNEIQDLLRSKAVALIFSKRSTRTRVSTEAAVQYMNGLPMFLGQNDIHLGVNESLHDTAKVISSMVSCIFARVGAHQEILDMVSASSVPIINALSDTYHPLQAITDIMTIKETFGHTKGLKLAWVGDSNNVVNDLATACAKSGISISIATPGVYPMCPNQMRYANTAAKETGVTIEDGHDPKQAVKNANIIVTDTWVSMGQETEKDKRLGQFKGFEITMDLMKEGGANSDWRFMHCLPRKKHEVNDEVFYSDKSLVFQEAENRLYTAIAVLEKFVVHKGKF